MKASVKKVIGGAEFIFEADEKDELETLSKVITMGNAPTSCGICESEDVHFSSNKSTSEKGTFVFVKVICKKCGARSNLGQYKTGGYFWKGWEKYSPPQQAEDGSA